MIISHKYQFIFIHCRKTAGSSISMMLSKSLGPSDVQLSALAETMEAGGTIPAKMYLETVRGLSCKSIYKAIFGEQSAHDAIASCAKQAYVSRLGKKPQHAKAAAIKAAFPVEWMNYYKFCVVRNPFSLAVSDYKWRTRHLENPPEFVEYLTALASGDELGGIVPVDFYNNWHQYTIADRIVVDDIILFEELSYDLPKVLSTIGVPSVDPLPHLKKIEKAGDQLNQHRYYDNPKATDLVSKLYQNEISSFGYRLE